MSAIFLLASLITLFLYSLKIYKLRLPQIGAVKGLVFANLVCLVMYNFLYSCGTKAHWASTFIDNFVNSLMMAFVLFLNLVLIDSRTEKINSNMSPTNIHTGIRLNQTP